MAIDLNKFPKGKDFKSADFDFNDPTDTISIKTGPGSSVGGAITAAIGAIPAVPVNTGATLPADASDTSKLMTAAGFNTIAGDTTTAGGNALQKAAVNAVEAAIGTDSGATRAIASAIAADTTATTAIANVLPTSTDTVKGMTTLVKAASATPTPSTADDKAASPAYVTALLSSPAGARAVATAIAADSTALASLLTALSVFGN